jgi:hypothetical protein
MIRAVEVMNCVRTIRKLLADSVERAEHFLRLMNGSTN